MKQNYFFKSLLVIILFSNMAFKCGCKKPIKQIGHLHVSISFKQEVIYLEDGRVPFTLTIKSNDEVAKDLKYTCVDWLVKDDLGKLVSASGEPIDPTHELVYGDNQLYYEPHAEGKHMLEITVSDEKLSVKKKQLLTFHVKDHVPVDFQLALKPEKSPAFVHEPVKLVLDISAHQKEATQLTYQIKEIITDKKGSLSATAQGSTISNNYDLRYGKNILYYNNTDKQVGIHDIRLIVANSKGDTQIVSASINILDTDFQAKLQLQKTTICFYEKAKLIINIASSQVGMDKFDYQIKEISTSVKGGEFFTTAEGSKLNAGHTLLYGKNILYYDPQAQLGTHDIKLVITNSNGNTQTVFASLEVIDIDFQIKIKPEKTQFFSYEPVKLVVDVSAKQENGQHLVCQLKAISTSIKGGKFLTAAIEGTPITTGQTLNYGKNVWYYIPYQPGNHEIQLIAVSSHGTTKEATVSLDVRYPDFQLEIKPEKTQAFSHDQVKLIVDISSKQESGQHLNYQLKEVNTNIEAGELSLTPQGTPLLSDQALQYGKNVWYYTPHEPGNHTLQIVVVSEGITKQATSVLKVNQATFSTEVKIEKPAKPADTIWEVELLLGSNSGLKEEQWELSSWQIEETGVGKLQDMGGYQVAEKGCLLQPGLNKFNLVLSKEIVLTSVPQLKLTIHQPDGKDKLLVVDLSKYVFSYLEKCIGSLIEQYDVAYQKLANKEAFAQDKFDRVEQQLQTLRSNLNILTQSTTINRDQLEDALASIEPKKLALNLLFKRQ